MVTQVRVDSPYYFHLTALLACQRLRNKIDYKGNEKRCEKLRKREYTLIIGIRSIKANHKGE